MFNLVRFAHHERTKPVCFPKKIFPPIFPSQKKRSNCMSPYCVLGEKGGKGCQKEEKMLPLGSCLAEGEGGREKAWKML